MWIAIAFRDLREQHWPSLGPEPRPPCLKSCLKSCVLLALSELPGVLCTVKSFNQLTHYHTILQFDALKIYTCKKHCEKRRNCLLQAVGQYVTLYTGQSQVISVFSMRNTEMYHSIVKASGVN